MSPSWLRGATRHLYGRSLASRLRTGTPSNRACSRPRTPITLERVQAIRSRVSPSTTTLLSCRRPLTEVPRDITFKHTPPITNPGPILQSAFPTKTVIFLLVLGVAVYYLVEILPEEEWSDGIYGAFANEQAEDSGAMPLHRLENYDEVEHWVEAHLGPILSHNSQVMKIPEALAGASKLFPFFVHAWEMPVQGSPVVHGIRRRSNKPCEDYFAVGTAPGAGEKPWDYYAIFDGHAGWQTAWYLQHSMIPMLSLHLGKLSSTSTSSIIHSAIKEAFVKQDTAIMEEARNAANWLPAANPSAIFSLIPALSGSCALVAAFDRESGKLHVANVGDSRAVLGRWDPISQRYVAKPLSVDQTGFNESEVSRIKAEHPGEDDILDPKTGRLLGLMVTRAFGDHRWKMDNELIKKIQAKFWGSGPRPQSKTPPYLTAEPEVMEVDIVGVDPRDRNVTTKSDFMIMASDGLWDHISSEHAVECVQRWMEAGDWGARKVSENPHLVPADYSRPMPDPEPGVEYDAETGTPVSWKVAPEYFSIEDDNAAACLARNALGGNRIGLVQGLLTAYNLPGSLSRNVLDDMTIIVVFFNKADPEIQANIDKQKKKSSWPSIPSFGKKEG